MRSLALAFLSTIVLVSFTGPAPSLEPAASGVEVGDTVTILDQDGKPVATDLVAYYVDIRSTYGLPSSLADVQRILSEHGEAFEWGFPMSPEEIAKVQGHVDIQLAMPEEVILGFHDISGYAGFYFDHLNDGAPTLMVTALDIVDEDVLAAVPQDLKDCFVLVEADYSWEELEADAWVAAHMADERVDDAIHRVAVKTIENRLEISVSDASEIDAVKTELSRVLTAPFLVVAEPMSVTETCTRESCASDMKGGIRVDGYSSATLGFGIMHGSDKQYLVAGHQTGGTYSHNGTSIGITAENEYFNDGIDARAIYAPDSYVSDDIYYTSSSEYDVIATSYPTVGYTVWLSGWKSGNRSGVIQDNYLLYSTSSATDLVGASANYYSQSGDSGGPVYRKSGSSAYAIGIHSTGTGDREFARCWDLNNRMGAYVLN